MTYKDWTKGKLLREIELLEGKLRAYKAIMVGLGTSPSAEAINALYKAEVILEELRKEYKLR